MNSARLHQQLTSHFSGEELRTLCFYLEIDYDSLPGEGKEAKARELIQYLERRGRMDELIAELFKLRPGVPWEDVAEESYSQPSVSTEIPAKAPPSTRPADPLVHERELHGIQEQLGRSRLILFVGADLPEAITGIPSRQDLADGLAAREGVVPGQRLATVAQQIMSHNNRFAFTDFLRNALSQAERSPQHFHDLCVTLVQKEQIETIITIAYDDLLESAFQQAGIGLNRVVSAEDLSFVRPQDPLLIKLYGDWQQVTSLVVTEQDQNALLRGRDKPDLVDEVRRAFRRNSVLFLGHDLSDPVLGALFDEIVGGSFQMPAYAVWSGLSQAELESFKSNRRLTVLETDPVDFLQHLLSESPFASGQK